jgi:hypothetical protein
MRIRFTPSTNFGEYHGWYEGAPLDFGAGQERDIPDEKARELLRNFPMNFQPVEVMTGEIEAAPVDRMMRKGRSKRR